MLLILSNFNQALSKCIQIMEYLKNLITPLMAILKTKYLLLFKPPNCFLEESFFNSFSFTNPQVNVFVTSFSDVTTIILYFLFPFFFASVDSPVFVLKKCLFSPLKM